MTKNTNVREQLFVKCDMTNYVLEFILIDNQTAILNTVYSDFSNILAFVNLLRLSYDKLVERKIKYVRQLVTRHDWDSFLKNKTSWKIVKENMIEQTYEIECDIENYLYNLGVGLGLKD